jgi:ribosomal protein S18 acetylase RimI-like enzyme
MTGLITSTIPSANDLDGVVQSLANWQQDGQIAQLHPGDIGWYQRFGAEATASAIRLWSIGDRVVAIGLLESPELLRLALDPDFEEDKELADQMASDVETMLEPEGCLEARSAQLLRNTLTRAGWGIGDPWTSLKMDLAKPVQQDILKIEAVASPEQVHDRIALQKASFTNSSFTEDKWHDMASGPAYARCLVGYDEDNNPVAMVTVWSAGNGRPGLIEPLGVDQKYQGKGYGRAITLAGAKVLQEMGAPSVFVCTESSNVAAVSAYKSAGFKELPEIRDLVRKP